MGWIISPLPCNQNFGQYPPNWPPALRQKLQNASLILQRKCLPRIGNGSNRCHLKHRRKCGIEIEKENVDFRVIVSWNETNPPPSTSRLRGATSMPTLFYNSPLGWNSLHRLGNDHWIRTSNRGIRTLERSRSLPDAEINNNETPRWCSLAATEDISTFLLDMWLLGVV